MSARAFAADTFMILGDSLSAGYRLSVEQAWPAYLAKDWQKSYPNITLVNASISGNTAAQGLDRLPELLKQHQPRWVLIELGANDGLRGFPVTQTQTDLQKTIDLVKAQGAEPLLMQIRIPPNYGKRYSNSFSEIYPKLAQENKITLLPFYMEDVAIKPQWIQEDGLHPNSDAQPFIARWMTKTLSPYIQ